MLEALDKLESLFGTRFSVSFGLPALLFFFVNLLVYEALKADLLGPAAFSPIGWYGQLGELLQIVVAAFAMLLLYLFSIMLSLIVPLLREILEGKRGVPLFANAMRLRQRDRLWALRRRRKTLHELSRKVPSHDSLKTSLHQARKLGESYTPAAAEKTARDALNDACKELDLLWAQEDLTSLSVNYWDELQPVLERAITAAILPFESEAESLMWDIYSTGDHLRARFEEEQAAAFSREVEEMPKHRLAPTAIGNIAEAWRSQTYRVYNMDANFFWPRLEPLLPEDSPLKDEIQDAKSRLDAMAVMAFLSLLFLAFWFPVSGLLGSSLPFFLCIALLGPLATGVFLLLSKQSYLVLGKKLRSAIDLYRFRVFEELHQALPKNLVQERSMWSMLQNVLSFNEPSNLRYNKDG
jgi:hypothetical protein